MAGTRRVMQVGTVTVLCALAGCGGEEAQRTGADKAGARGLKAPLHPRCGTEGFGRPRIDSLTSPDTPGAAWSLTYNRAPSPGRRVAAGETTRVIVAETAPGSAPAASADPAVEERTIAGRRVRYRARDADLKVFSAQWGTAKAYYSAIANGRTPATLERFIACLP